MGDLTIEQEIRARWSAATPGPWQRHAIFTESIADASRVLFTMNSNFDYQADVEALARAPEDIEWLLADRDDAWRLVTLWRDKYNRRFDEKETAASDPRELCDIGKEMHGIAMVVESFGEKTAPGLLKRMRELCREWLATGEDADA